MWLSAVDRQIQSWEGACGFREGSNGCRQAHPCRPEFLLMKIHCQKPLNKNHIGRSDYTIMASGLEPVVITALIFGGCCTNVFALEAIVK